MPIDHLGKIISVQRRAIAPIAPGFDLLVAIKGLLKLHVEQICKIVAFLPHEQ